MASISLVSLNWLQLLEKEFDLSFVDCDTVLANVFASLSEIEESNAINGQQLSELMSRVCDARQHLTAISAAFAQLVHKTVTIANHNENLAKEVSELRRDVCDARAYNNVERTLSSDQLSNGSVDSNNKYNSTNNSFERNSFDILRMKSKKSDENKDQMKGQLKRTELKRQECIQLRKENIALRRQTVQLQSELFGSRLAAKYLDKELAGRIQQIQLLGRDVRDNDHERLWNQLEAEIHLHRHKTVVRACRGQCFNGYQFPAPTVADSAAIKRRQGIGDIRTVTVAKKESDGLGISITGGKEHGIPIIISQIHDNTPAAQTGALYVGDAILSVNSIDLRDAKHSDAAHILSEQKGDCILEVIFVSPEEEQSDDESIAVVNDGSMSSIGLTAMRTDYPFYDPHVIDVNSLSLVDASNDSESADDDSSAVTEPVISTSSSPTKRYPGVAMLSAGFANNSESNDSICAVITHNGNDNVSKSKETVIN